MAPLGRVVVENVGATTMLIVAVAVAAEFATAVAVNVTDSAAVRFVGAE